MPPATLAGVAALGALFMAWPPAGPGSELRRARVMLAGGGSLVPPARWPSARVGEWGARLRRRARARRELVCLPLGGAVALLGGSVMPLLAALVAVPLVRRWLAARGERRERERREAAVIELCGAVAGELRAGRQPGQALAGVSAGHLGPQWTAVSAAARFGGDVPEALRAVAARPGAEGLHGVAACWRVAVDGGAGLAAGLERVSAALSAERDQREELRAQLAGARSTAVMLALLPVLALLMGSALGAAPLRVLLHTPAGLGCLLLGGLLEAAGIAWTGRIVRAAAGERGGAGDPGGPGTAEGKVP
ncbi:type II secretion system F family protein [Streptomyces hiroshimensis]